jgi:hypothetical protein
LKVEAALLTKDYLSNKNNSINRLQSDSNEKFNLAIRYFFKPWILKLLLMVRSQPALR